MKPLRQWFARLNRVQQSRLFKIIASVVVIAIAIALFSVYALQQAKSVRLVANDYFSTVDTSKMTTEEKQAFDEAKSTHDITVLAFNQLLSSQTDSVSVGVGVAVAAGVCLAVIWLGLGLTSLAFGLLLGAIAVPIWFYGAERYALGAKFTIAVGVLTFCFIVLMRSLRSLLGFSSPVIAIARNVVIEATRMRVAIIFILLLIFGLAALPGLLDPSTPLRYRVQNFLQYGTGGAFSIISVLVVFLSVATVAFEQRDKVIWQTMTKPVAAWQYLLGKWIGVVGVAAILLAVSCSGIFLFTEYLRNQPAQGELAAFVPKEEDADISEDRAILESQVLNARTSVRPDVTVLTDADEQKEFKRRLDESMRSDPTFRLTSDDEETWRDQIRKEVRASQFTIEPGEGREYIFSGLERARAEGRFITLRYKVDVGANDPRTIYNITFLFRNVDHSTVQQVPVGQALTIPLQPAAIDPNGKLYVWVGNGRPITDTQFSPNPQSLSFPPDGLEVYFPAGSYRMNFLRVALVLWFKLAFLAMVGVTSATFLSFPVAAMTAFGVFMMAESASFLKTALDYYATVDDKGNIDYFASFIRGIAYPISRGFSFYSDLRPTSRLVDGLVIPWSTVAKAAMIISLLCGILYAIAVSIFRKRELAMYSGQ